MAFMITGIDPAPFRHLYERDDADLRALGVERHRVDAVHRFPDRVELRDLDIGEYALLLNYEHHAADTPYRARHAIFVKEGAEYAARVEGELPDVMRRRTLSLRGFDAAGHMRDADLVEGVDAESLIMRLFADPAIAFIHAHYAKRGCYAGLILRA